MSKALTYTTRNFAVTIVEQDGRRGFSFDHPRHLEHDLQEFKVGDKASLYVTSKKPKRSDQQSRYYFGVYLPLISKDTGHSIDELHEYFKGKCLPTKIVTVLGEQVRLKKSTTNLSIGEFCDYIANIYQLTNIMPPETEDYQWK